MKAIDLFQAIFALGFRSGAPSHYPSRLNKITALTLTRGLRDCLSQCFRIII